MDIRMDTRTEYCQNCGEHFNSCLCLDEFPELTFSQAIQYFHDQVLERVLDLLEEMQRTKIREQNFEAAALISEISKAVRDQKQ